MQLPPIPRGLVALFRFFRSAPRIVTDGASPPNDEAHRTWTFRPDLAGSAQWDVGPTGTVTTPVQTQGPPGYYTFATGDVITFGDALDATWTNGFTIYCLHEIQAGDVDGTDRYLVFKGNSGGNRQWTLKYNSGIGYFARVFYNNSALQYDQDNPFTDTAVATGGKRIVAFTYNPAGVRNASRVNVYVSSAPYISPLTSQLGADGTMSDTTAVLTIGADSGASNKAVSRIGSVYAYSTVHTPSQILENMNWMRNQLNWM